MQKSTEKYKTEREKQKPKFKNDEFFTERTSLDFLQ
jgi:hypothetical protein